MDWTKLDWTGPNGLLDPWGHGSILHHNRNKLDLGNFVNKMPHMDLDHLRGMICLVLGLDLGLVCFFSCPQVIHAYGCITSSWL